jgi:hypothetical protein
MERAAILSVDKTTTPIETWSAFGPTIGNIAALLPHLTPRPSKAIFTLVKM